jgi:small subunit ribosomal protein S17
MYTRRKTRLGVVTSDKMQKTVVVAVESHKRHPLYHKTMRRTTRYKVHDEKELAKVGDTVRIIESRPLSREKRWRLAEVLTRREVAEIAPREIDASMLGINRPHTDSQAAVAPEAAVVAEAEAPVAKEGTTAESELSAEEAPAEPEVEAAPVEAESEPEISLSTEEAPAEPEVEAAPAEAENEPETPAEQKEEQTKE